MREITESALTILSVGTGQKPRGRPRVEQPLDASVTVWLPAKAHDRLIKLAEKHEKSVSALVRDWLKIRISR